MGGTKIVSPDDPDSSFWLLDTYTTLGGNFIDTASIYGRWLPGGINTSEQNIGKWLKSRKNRQDIILATKGGHPAPDRLEQPRLFRQEVEQDLDNSLSALNTTYIDLYWLHRDDERLPVPVMMNYLNDFAAQGKIRFFGCSNWRPERIREAIAYTEREGLQGFTANQMMWSLARPNEAALKEMTLTAMDTAAWKLHKETGLAAVPFSSQAKGFFEKYEQEGEAVLPSEVKALYLNDENRLRFRRLKQMAEHLTMPVTVVALSYLFSQPVETFPVIGCRTTAQLEASMKAGGLFLTEEEIAFLEGK